MSDDPELERKELAEIYVRRDLDSELARQMADQLTTKDALAAHAQDELHISHATSARPIQAADVGDIATGAMLPLLAVLLVPGDAITPVGRDRFAHLARTPWRGRPHAPAALG